MKQKEANIANMRLEYKGYTSILTPNPKDKGRLYGRPCPPGSTTPLDTWMFAGNNIEEATKYFKCQVDKIIMHEAYRKRQEIWLNNNDYLSVASVLNILPDTFEKRILNNTFDKHLLTKVTGGDYEVPLYYVTKAWDEILNKPLDYLAFMIGPEEDEGCSKEAFEEFIQEEDATRVRCQAILDNNKMKTLWMKYFGVDIDELNIDFCQYNMHIPNNASDIYVDYFQDVPDGVIEWLLPYPIIRPSETWATYDSVSSLMELTAYIIKVVRSEPM